MSDIDQNQTARVSEYEKLMFIRDAFLGLIAVVSTLWIGNVFEDDGPSLFSFEVILA